MPCTVSTVPLQAVGGTVHNNFCRPILWGENNCPHQPAILFFLQISLIFVFYIAVFAAGQY